MNLRNLILLLTLMMPIFTLANDNPFAGEDDAEITVVEEVSETPVVIKDTEEAKLPLWYGYIQWQKSINDKLSSTMLALKENFSFVNLFLIFIISLFYSLLHTAGPGHGKVILGTYFLTSNAKHQKRDASLAGIIVSLVHIGTAFLLSFFFYVVLKSLTAGSQSGDMTEKGTFFGGIMVLITGVVIIVSSLPVVKNRFHSIEEKAAKTVTGKGSLVWFSILSGIVPCPLAWIVLIFSISYNIYGYGIVSVVGMAIGAAITVGTTGAVVIHLKDKAESMFPIKKIKGAATVMRVLGATMLIFIGLSMTFL